MLRRISKISGLSILLVYAFFFSVSNGYPQQKLDDKIIEKLTQMNGGREQLQRIQEIQQSQLSQEAQNRAIEAAEEIRKTGPDEIKAMESKATDQFNQDYDRYKGMSVPLEARIRNELSSGVSCIDGHCHQLSSAERAGLQKTLKAFEDTDYILEIGKEEIANRAKNLGTSDLYPAANSAQKLAVSQQGAPQVSLPMSDPSTSVVKGIPSAKAYNQTKSAQEYVRSPEAGFIPGASRFKKEYALYEMTNAPAPHTYAKAGTPLPGINGAGVDTKQYSTQEQMRQFKISVAAPDTRKQVLEKQIQDKKQVNEIFKGVGSVPTIVQQVQAKNDPPVGVAESTGSFQGSSSGDNSHNDAAGRQNEPAPAVPHRQNSGGNNDVGIIRGAAVDEAINPVLEDGVYLGWGVSRNIMNGKPPLPQGLRTPIAPPSGFAAATGFITNLGMTLLQAGEQLLRGMIALDTRTGGITGAGGIYGKGGFNDFHEGRSPTMSAGGHVLESRTLEAAPGVSAE